MSLAVSRCEELVGRRCCGPSEAAGTPRPCKGSVVQGKIRCCHVGPRGPRSPRAAKHLRSADDRRRLWSMACPMPRHRAPPGTARAVDRRPMKCPINVSARLLGARFDERRYITFVQHRSARLRTGQDRRRLVSGRWVVHAKRQLERRAHRDAGVNRAVVGFGRRWDPVRRRRIGGPPGRTTWSATRRHF